MLRIEHLRITYGNAVEAVRDLSLDVPAGGIVALLGANGAGKSTVLKAISGVLAAEGGRIAGGDIAFEGASLRGIRADDAVRRGIAQVPEGRRLFARLTVAENLSIGGFLRGAAERADTLARILDLFPPLTDKLSRAAGLLSGGEQQMVALGRALMARPRLLMLDEPSLGLAPVITGEIFAALARLRGELGLTILLIEQNASRALALADRATVMEGGRVAASGAAAALAADPMIRAHYLGLSDSGTRRNVREAVALAPRVRWPA